MRRTLLLALAAILLLPTTIAGPAAPVAAQEDVPNILVWTGTYGFRHPSITDAQVALLEMQSEGHFTVTITENPAQLRAELLRDYDAVMWVSTTGKPPMTEEQRADLIRFAGCGGGTVGFHAALDSNYGWAEHAELFGAQFDSHPQNAGAGAPTMLVEDREHPITEGWHDVESFEFDDEYYRWRSTKGIDGVSLPREFGDTNVLLSLDETTVAEGIQEGPTPYEHHQPIAWTKTFRDRGRVYYNNMGHSGSTWSLPEFRTALVNGVRWVTEVPLDLACFDGDEPLPPAPTPHAPDPARIGRACDVPELQIRDNGTWEQSGEARALTVEGDTVELAAGIPGGLGWGAQTYILDLSSTGAATGTVTLTLAITNPADDYDLGVTTAWGWYGSDQAAGVTAEELVIEDVPHCAYLHVTGDNMLATATAGPTLLAVVVPDPPAVPGVADVTRLVADSDAPADLARAWSPAPARPSCSCALLARDDDFADALASGGAQAGGVPLLLTDRDGLTPSTATELEEMGIEQVTILGGTAAVSQGVADELAERGITVTRIAGDTRVLTAVAIARAAFPTVAAPPLVLRAYGDPAEPTSGFADSLAAGREAARAGRPVLLTTSDGLSPEVADYLAEAEVDEVVVVGGVAAVGEQVVTDLEQAGVTVTRVAGESRFGTATAVAAELAGAADASAADGVLLLDGTAPTAWAEGFAAAGAGFRGPIVLADGDGLPPATQAWLGQVAGTVPLTCGALAVGPACDAAAVAMGLE